MMHETLLIGRWHVDFLFFDAHYDVDWVRAFIKDLDASDEDVGRVVEIAESDREDTGFTYTDGTTRRGLLVVGPSSSPEEFINTFVHEIHHLAVAIASGLGMDLDSEAPAYLAGDLAMSFAETVCRLGCPCQHSATHDVANS